MNKVTVPAETIEQHITEIQEWLNNNAGIGSARFGGRQGHIRHWLNGDDWLYYEEVYVPEENDHELVNSNYVFVFRDEKIATEFALRFA